MKGLRTVKKRAKKLLKRYGYKHRIADRKTKNRKRAGLKGESI